MLSHGSDQIADPGALRDDKPTASHGKKLAHGKKTVGFAETRRQTPAAARSLVVASTYKVYISLAFTGADAAASAGPSLAA